MKTQLLALAWALGVLGGLGLGSLLERRFGPKPAPIVLPAPICPQPVLTTYGGRVRVRTDGKRRWLLCDGDEIELPPDAVLGVFTRDWRR